MVASPDRTGTRRSTKAEVEWCSNCKTWGKINIKERNTELDKDILCIEIATYLCITDHDMLVLRERKDIFDYLEREHLLLYRCVSSQH